MDWLIDVLLIIVWSFVVSSPVAGFACAGMMFTVSERRNPKMLECDRAIHACVYIACIVTGWYLFVLFAIALAGDEQLRRDAKGFYSPLRLCGLRPALITRPSDIGPAP